MDAAQSRHRSGTALLALLMSPWFRASALLGLLIVAGVLATRTQGLGVTALRAAFDGAGAGGPVLYAATYALAATLLLPGAPFTIAAGLLFGPVLGSATALVGAVAGATGAFWLGRALGRDAVARIAPHRLGRFDAVVARRGFAGLLLVRLVPLFPFNLVNVGSGVTGIAARDYVLATAVGIVPGTVVYAALGGTIDEPTSPAFLGALAAFVVVTALSWLAARRLRPAAALCGVAGDDRAGATQTQP